MCLAVPLQIVEIHGLDGIGERGGIRRAVRLDFIPNPQVGDYVIVHAGFAIERLREEQALADLEAAAELDAEMQQIQAELAAVRQASPANPNSGSQQSQQELAAINGGSAS